MEFSWITNANDDDDEDDGGGGNNVCLEIYGKSKRCRTREMKYFYFVGCEQKKKENAKDTHGIQTNTTAEISGDERGGTR